jgi:hypothetical protein
MGLNWSEGLNQLGAGMDRLGAVMQNTEEMDYKRMRDKNLRRFQVEDRDFEAEEKRKAAELKVTQTDEAVGIGDSERAESYRTQASEASEAKHAQELEKIYARNKGKAKAGAKGLSRQAYIDREMTKMTDAYNAAVGDPTEVGETPRVMPKRLKDMYYRIFGQDYDNYIAQSAEEPFAPGNKTEAKTENKVLNWDDM